MKIRVPKALSLMREDLQTALQRDPAATNTVEVALTYPGVHALWGYRIGHAMWKRGLRFPARLLQSATRFATGVDIHPAASIGRRLFIDHAMGVVVGQTAVIEEDVLIFHGVTLGGVSMSPGKRHPTVRSHATVGAGAKILGPIEIGEHVRVGANAVVIRDVPAGSVAVGVPATVRRIGTTGINRDLMTEPSLYI